MSKLNFRNLFIQSLLFPADTLHLALTGATSLACFLCIPYFTHWCSHYNLPKPRCPSIQEFKNTIHLACLYWHKHIFYPDSAWARGDRRATSQGKVFNNCTSICSQPTGFVLGCGCKTCLYLNFGQQQNKAMLQMSSLTCNDTCTQTEIYQQQCYFYDISNLNLTHYWNLTAENLSIYELLMSRRLP